MATPVGLASTADATGIQSVEVAGALLRALLRAGGAMRLVDISRATSMPSAKARRYLISLQRTGLVAQDPATARYDLGPLAMQIGLKSFARFEPLRLAESVLQDLVAEVGETCAISVWGDDAPTIVRVAEARHVFAGNVALSHHCPLTWSATGLTFCAFGDADRTGPAILRDLEQNRATNRRMAPHDRAALETAIAAVRAAGVATVADGGGEGRAALAVPVIDPSGDLAMVLTIFGRLGRIDIASDGALARIARGAADRLSAAWGPA